ncbi:MAG: polyprenyl synthetase family protein [Candidatus Sericytochromatia bacterium]|nr:polyprenyl synthetase family protein [Candidatus Sericytochromatia bacterium]
MDARRYRPEVAQAVSGGPERLRSAAAHLEGEGKAVRRQCVRLVGEALGAGASLAPSLETLADAVEWVHLGSLIHDDLLDDAATRRGKPSVHVRWNHKVAVLAGDLVISRAARAMAGLGLPVLTVRLAEVLGDLCEGELVQDDQRWDVGVDRDAYLERIRLKTSGPFELACEGAAILSGAPAEVTAACRRLGFHLGRLFQMVDDVLDYGATSEALAKPAGRDLADGLLTLPALAVIEDEVLGAALRRKMEEGRFPEMADVVPALVHPRVVARVEAALAVEAEGVHQALHGLPDGAARDALVRLVTDLGQRAERACRALAA